MTQIFLTREDETAIFGASQADIIADAMEAQDAARAATAPSMDIRAAQRARRDAERAARAAAPIIRAAGTDGDLNAIDATPILNLA